MTVLSIDFETRATVNLRDTGVYPYAEHPHTGIWCMAWAFDDEEPEIWEPGMEFWGPYNETPYPLPLSIISHIAGGCEIRAWNAEFERVIWDEIMVKRYGAPQPKLEQWVCSAAEAAAMALPRALGQCAEVLGVSQQKDEAGHRLMMQMTRPRSRKADGAPVWWEVADKKERLFEYCRQDVRTERAITPSLRRLTPMEREHYLQTARMNDRGLTLDINLVQAAKQIANEGVERANAALTELTGGQVTEVTNHGRLTAWLNTQLPEKTVLADNGVYKYPVKVPAVESVSKAAVRDLLTGELVPPVRAALELRQDAGRSSLAKLDSFQDCVCADGKIRGMLMYHGASTGRWTGRLAQLHNLPRPTIDNIEDFIEPVLANDYDGIDLFHHPLEVIVAMLRSTLTASPGHELLAADYSAIEARVLNWLAGQDDVLALFAAGEDVYSYNAGRFPGAEPYRPGKKHPLRQTGKFQELGCGFGMGAKKAVAAGKAVYGLELTEEEAKTIVDNYRATHTRVVDFWKETEDAAMEAVAVPGAVQTFGALRNLRFVKQGAYLYLLLPAKRPLVYAAPKIVERKTPWGEMRPAVEISAVDSFTRKWGRQGMYGGLWVENIVQAVSRDLMAEGKLRLEAAGYPVLLSVHDEVIAEKPISEGCLEEFETLLATPPAWAAGCPIATEGWRGFRYRK
jgi:DNA polymerase